MWNALTVIHAVVVAVTWHKWKCQWTASAIPSPRKRSDKKHGPYCCTHVYERAEALVRFLSVPIGIPSRSSRADWVGGGAVGLVCGAGRREENPAPALFLELLEKTARQGRYIRCSCVVSHSHICVCSLHGYFCPFAHVYPLQHVPTPSSCLPGLAPFPSFRCSRLRACMDARVRAFITRLVIFQPHLQFGQCPVCSSPDYCPRLSMRIDCSFAFGWLCVAATRRRGILFVQVLGVSLGNCGWCNLIMNNLLSLMILFKWYNIFQSLNSINLRL